MPARQRRTRATPLRSALSGANNGRQIGYQAVAAQASDAGNTIASVKRFMGRGLQDVAQGTIALRICAASRRRHGQHCHGRRRENPVEVSAEILATLRYRAEDTFNDDLYGAVITVPAYFDDAQRQATKMQPSWQASICCALSTNPPPLPLPTGWTMPARVCTRCMTWAAVPSIFRSCA